MRKLSIFATYCVLVLGLAARAYCQTNMGMPVLQAFFDASPYESINLSNLNILLHAPVLSRGGPLPLNFNLSQNVMSFPAYDAGKNLYFWQAMQTLSPGNYVQGLGLGPVGFGSNYAQGGVLYQQLAGVQCPGKGGFTTEFRFVGIVDSYGTNHPLSAAWYVCNGGTVGDYTHDASGLTLYASGSGSSPTVTVYDNSGTYISSASPGVVTDSHGNTLTIAEGTSSPYTITYTGPLSTTALLSFPDPAKGSTGTTENFTYTDGTGTQRNVTVAYSSGLLYGPPFSCPGWEEITSTNNLYPVHTISWPDGSSLSAVWETSNGYYTGRLSSLTLPTGGTATYAYSGGTSGQGWWCSNSSPAYLFPATITRSIGGGTWTFALTLDANYVTNHTSYTTVTKPDGSKIAYTFINGYTTNEITYDTNGSTVLDTVKTCYNSTLSNCASTAGQNISSVAVYDYVPGIANPSAVITSFDAYGNVTEVDRNDFGPTLVNKTVNTYGSWNGSSCTAFTNNITNRVCETSVFDASSNKVADSIMNYYTDGDRYYIQSQVSGGNYLSTVTTFNANGTMATLTTPDGVQTTFAYNGTGGCPSSSPAFLATSSTNSIGTASMTWDCNGAVPLTTTDLNGLVTTTTYGDPLYRPTLIHDSGGQSDVSFTYTSATRSSRDMTFNSGNSIEDATTTLDTLGRTLSVQRKQSPTATNYDTVSFAYDSTGHLTSTSQACATTVGGTCTNAAVSYAYDGMNRPKTKTVNTSTPGVLTYAYQNGDVTTTLSPAPTGEHNKITQAEYDGLGRLLSSCAVWTTGGSGSGACNQRTSGSGYLTKYTLDALGRATQVSRNAQTGGTAVNTCATYDHLGRVTQSAVPESGGTCTSGAPSGNTSSFYYDAVTSSCSAFGTFTVNPGQLAQTTDPYNNKNCANYDGVGRLSNVYPISGPNQSVTPARYFCYDGNTSCHGHAGSNLLGRLSDTGTTFSPYTTATADEQFGYDLYGRVTDRWQTSPGLSGSYFHTTAGYFDNGGLYALGGIPGVSGYTYNVDGEGRPYSATSNSTTIVSSVTYDAASNPLTITYGNGDTDAYTWDANSHDMTQWQLKLNSVSDTGVPTWNPNGTLKQLAITDSISGTTDSQTCTTAHDDLARITSFNCGSVWNESYAFSADYAGNVTKSGSLSFAPGYVASTNQFASGSGCTYDGNGNILHDCTLSQNYTWDSFGGMASSAGTSLVDDANGDMVQKGSGTYFVSSPLGELGSTTSLTAPLSLKIPLPGGASITYDNAGNQQLNRKDFRGSTVLRTNRAARTLVDVFCYGPMGEIYCGTPVNSQFEGTFEDTSSGLADFNATRYSGTQGRTQSPTGGANGYVKNNSPF